MDSNNEIPEYRVIKSWGNGLTGDKDDEKMLQSLSVLDREAMLAERAEKVNSYLLHDIHSKKETNYS